MTDTYVRYTRIVRSLREDDAYPIKAEFSVVDSERVIPLTGVPPLPVIDLGRARNQEGLFQLSALTLNVDELERDVGFALDHDGVCAGISLWQLRKALKATRQGFSQLESGAKTRMNFPKRRRLILSGAEIDEASRRWDNGVEPLDIMFARTPETKQMIATLRACAAARPPAP